MNDTEIKNEIEKICWDGDEERLKNLMNISDCQQELTALDTLFQSSLPLIWATEKGHVKIVKLLINNNVDFNQRNDKNETALLVAIEKGNTQIIDIILRYYNQQLDLNNKNSSEWKDEAFFKACEKADVYTAQKLIEMGANLNCKKGKYTPLYLVIEKVPMPKLKTIVEFLLDKGVETKVDSSPSSPLFSAINKGHEEIVRILIERDAALNFAHLKFSDKFPAIFSLISEKLLEKDKRNFLKEISTIYIPSLVNASLIEKLLENNAWIEIDLSNIRMNNRQERRREYFDRRNRLDEYYVARFHNETQIDFDREMEQHYRERRNLFYEFLTPRDHNETQNDINRDMGQRYFDRNNLLNEQYEQTEEFNRERLLNNNRRIEKPGKFVKKYQNVFFWSCKYGHKKILERLLKHHQNEIDINTQDSVTEQTGLIMACINVHLNIAELLIEYGANFGLKDTRAKTCFDYLKGVESDLNYVEELRGFYLNLKNKSDFELRKITLQRLLNDSSIETGFIIKPVYLISFELVNYEKLLTEASYDSLFMVYFIGCEFQEKLICDIINLLKDFQDALESQMKNSVYEFLETYSVDILQYIPDDILRFDLMLEQTRSSLVSLIDVKLNFIGELQRTIDKKRPLLIKLANVIFGQEIENPLNEIDSELEKFYDKKFVENYFSKIGFNAIKELVNDDFMCFRALSDEFYGDEKYYSVIHKKICQHLKINEAKMDKTLEKSGKFQECEVLNAFSFIYECKINIHQIDKDLITIDVNIESLREINILFYNNRYASLIRIV
jgi:ankyrin repeat protein